MNNENYNWQYPSNYNSYLNEIYLTDPHRDTKQY